MRANLARLDSVLPDWTQVGGWLAAAVAAGTALYAGFRNNWKGTGTGPPSDPGRPPEHGDIAVDTLRKLIQTLAEENQRLLVENQRLWVRIKELEQRDDDRDRQGDLRDANIDRFRQDIRKLRGRLIQAGIDPEDGA